MKRSLRLMDWPLQSKVALLLLVALVLPLGIGIFASIHQTRVQLLANTINRFAPLER